MHFGRGLRGGGHNWKKHDHDFFHVSEHVDQFKVIKVSSLRKKPEMVWLGGTLPPTLDQHGTGITDLDSSP